MSQSPTETWNSSVANFASFVTAVDDWDAASPCPGWTIADLVRHTIDLEALLAADPRPEHVPDWSSLPHIDSDFGRLTEVGVDYRRGRSKQELLAELADAHSRALARIESLPADASIPWLRGDTPIDRLLGMRTFDIWVHEQDARVATGQIGNLTGPGATLAMHYLSAGLPKVWGKGAGAPIGSVLHVVITDSIMTGEFWVRVGQDGKAAIIDKQDVSGEADVTATMPWLAFVMLAGGRATERDYARDVVVAGNESLGSAFLGSMAVTP